MYGRFVDSASSAAGLRHRRRPIALVSFQRARADQVCIAGALARASRVPRGADRCDCLHVPMPPVTPEEGSGLPTVEARTISHAVEREIRSFGPSGPLSRLHRTSRTACRFPHPRWRGERCSRIGPPDQSSIRGCSDYDQKNELRTRGPTPCEDMRTLSHLPHWRALKHRETRCGPPCA